MRTRDCRHSRPHSIGTPAPTANWSGANSGCSTCIPVGRSTFRRFGRLAAPPRRRMCMLAGRSFTWDGKGKLSDLKLPAGAVLQSDAKKEHHRGSLIVQAEIGPKGEIFYGVLGQNEIKMATASELASMKTLADLEKEDRGRGLRSRKAGAIKGVAVASEVVGTPGCVSSIVVLVRPNEILNSPSTRPIPVVYRSSIV